MGTVAADVAIWEVETLGLIGQPRELPDEEFEETDDIAEADGLGFIKFAREPPDVGDITELGDDLLAVDIEALLLMEPLEDLDAIPERSLETLVLLTYRPIGILLETCYNSHQTQSFIALLSAERIMQ